MHTGLYAALARALELQAAAGDAAQPHQREEEAVLQRTFQGAARGNAPRDSQAQEAQRVRGQCLQVYILFSLSVWLCHISSTSLVYPIAPPTALPAMLPNAQPVLPPNALPAALLAPVRQPAGPCCPLRRPVHCLAQRAAGRAARADAAAGACARARAAHCAAQCNAGVMHWTAQRAAQARAQAPAAAPARGARPSALCTAGVAC